MNIKVMGTIQQRLKSTTNIKVFSILLFSLRSFFKNWAIFIYLGLFSLGILAFNITIPLTSVLGAVINLFTISTVLLILGVYSRKLRESTIYNNLLLTGTNKYNFYLSQAIFTAFITIIVMFAYWFAYWCMAGIGLFHVSNYSSFFDPNGGLFARIRFNAFGNHEIKMIILLIFPTALLSFSLYFLFYSISSSDRIYFILVLSFFISGLIFGGTINFYFQLGIGGDFANPDSVPTLNMTAHSGSFANIIFWPTYILQPAFGLGSINANITIYTWILLYYVNTPPFHYAVTMVFYHGPVEHAKAVALIVQPYLFSAIYIIIGVLMSKYRK